MSANPVVGAERKSMNRKVWVLNRYHEVYTEEFRGQVITIPANNEKKVKMSYLKAERFLGNPVCPPDELPNGDYTFPPKALYIQAIESEPEVKDETFSCMLCEFETQSSAGFKQHMTVKHPDRKPIKEDDT